MKNYVNIELKSDLKNIMLARNIGAAFLYTVDPTISFLQEVKTIISEAVTNCIIHGYEKDENKKVYMNLSYDDEYCYFEFIDYGVGIKDIEQARMPMFTTKQEEERSGLGFTIIEVFTDELIVESKVNEGTTVRCKKKLQKKDEEPFL